LGPHKKMNPKTGGKGKKKRGDVKQEIIFGHKGIAKEQRDPKGISRITLTQGKKDIEINKDDLSILRMLYSRKAFDYGSAIPIDIIMASRINIEKKDWEWFISEFVRKFSEKRWIVKKTKPTDRGNLIHLFLNSNKTHEIYSFIRNPSTYLQ